MMAEKEPAATSRAELFALPVDEFVAARDQLVRLLKDDGDTDEAAGVGKLRRPTLAAWAVNQVVRGHPDEYGELVTAGEQVQRAQRKALSGVRDSGLRDASASRRELVERLTGRARTVLVEAGARPESHLDDVAATFEAASADPRVAEQVGVAQLSAPIAVEADFAASGGLWVLPSGDADDGDRDEDGEARDSAEAEQRRAAMRALEAARTRAEASATALRRARDEATSLSDRAEKARREAVAAREAAERAEAEAADLAGRAEQAATDVEAATATADRDAAAVEQARETLEGLA